MVSPGVKIITIEDPVEYELEGTTQIQVHPEAGLGFATALRSVLRQDPDVVMVGEIRDRETAEIAIQAALTGHLVLSTLHTESAAAAVPRLVDMGVDPFLVAATLRAAVAQRLVRRLCTACRVPRAVDDTLRRWLGPEHAAVETVYEAGSCPACGGIGFAGRSAVGELLEVDDGIRRLISTSITLDALREAACRGGMRPLATDARRVVASGATARSEIARTSVG